jgi:hypothetical protein
MNLISLTHANLNTVVEVVAVQVFAYYYSQTHKATLVLAVGGAMLPVKESVDEVKAKIEAIKAPTQL